MADKPLSLIEYMSYIEATTNSRCLIEGEEVLNAGHIVLHGRSDCSPSAIKICAVCLQTSALQSHPHEITGELKICNGAAKIFKMHCSCKAGAGGRCKHISAFLILLTRKNLSELEDISKTQLSCLWTNTKGSIKEKYKATCITEMPCIKPKLGVAQVAVNNDSLRSSILEAFIKKLPKSAIAKHFKGRQNSAAAVAIDKNSSVPSEFTQILDNAAQSVLMMQIHSMPSHFSFSCCEGVFCNILNEPACEMIKLNQMSSEWYNARQFRITGSRCYEIYTYKGTCWETKSRKYFWPKSFTNKFVKHGLKYEKDARTAFVNQTGHRVIKCGMLISPQNKWLGFSPDGIVVDGNGDPVALLEIKCLFEGSKASIRETVPSCQFLKEENGVFYLKKKHKYYGQVQLGMGMLNLSKCFLVLYASFDKSLLIIEIDFDFEFALEMLKKVKVNYFSKMMHSICNDD